MTHNEYRTHNCGELRLSNVGQKVTIAGWINSIRNLGGLKFVTLRDHFGITQLLVDGIDLPNKESVISATGTVVERESKNPKMPTGDIEIKVESIKLAGIQSTWHQKISCSFWTARCKNWSLHFQKIMIVHIISYKLQKFRPKNYFFVIFGISQIKISIL